jgi:hypothetical protein
MSLDLLKEVIHLPALTVCAPSSSASQQPKEHGEVSLANSCSGKLSAQRFRRSLLPLMRVAGQRSFFRCQFCEKSKASNASGGDSFTINPPK